jgi:hypothetical protein
MVWGAISIKGRSKLYFLNNSETSDEYSKLLQDRFLLHADDVYGGRDRYIFVQDNARPHTGGEALHTLRVNQVKCVAHPARSPDLNPIELVWAAMRRYIYKELQPRTTAEFKAAIIQAWKKFTTDFYRAKFIGKLHTVAAKVISCNGSNAFKEGGKKVY